MKKLITLTSIFLFTFLITNNLISQDATDDQIAALLVAMQAEEQFIFSMEATMATQKESPQAAMVPEGFFDEFLKEAKARFKTELFPQMSDIYKQNLTADEVIKLTEFYSTDIGKLLLNKMPLIQTESANAGMVWGQQLGMEVAQKLDSKK